MLSVYKKDRYVKVFLLNGGFSKLSDDHNHKNYERVLTRQQLRNRQSKISLRNRGS